MVDLNEAANVQYDEWLGSIAADAADVRGIEEFLGVDAQKERILAFHVAIYGGSQSVTPYVVDAEMTYAQLEDLSIGGQLIPVREAPSITFEIDDWGDPVPPRPEALPIASPTDFLKSAFKRLEMVVRTAHLPEGAQLQVVPLNSVE